MWGLGRGKVGSGVTIPPPPLKGDSTFLCLSFLSWKHRKGSFVFVYSRCCCLYPSTSPPGRAPEAPGTSQGTGRVAHWGREEAESRLGAGTLGMGSERAGNETPLQSPSHFVASDATGTFRLPLLPHSPSDQVPLQAPARDWSLSLRREAGGQPEGPRREGNTNGLAHLSSVFLLRDPQAATVWNPPWKSFRQSPGATVDAWGPQVPPHATSLAAQQHLFSQTLCLWSNIEKTLLHPGRVPAAARQAGPRHSPASPGWAGNKRVSFLSRGCGEAEAWAAAGLLGSPGTRVPTPAGGLGLQV